MNAYQKNESALTSIINSLGGKGASRQLVDQSTDRNFKITQNDINKSFDQLTKKN
jgi:hypothetical protein